MRSVLIFAFLFFQWLPSARAESEKPLPRYILTFKTPQAAQKFKAPKGTRIYKVLDIYLILLASQKPELKGVQIQADETYTVQAGCSPLVQNQIDTSRWDMELPNLDLMNEELKKMGIDPTKDKLAVIDSGFDPSNEGVIQGGVKTSSYLPYAASDKFGHGTMVTDRIFTASPGSQVTAYNVLPEGKADASDIMIAAYMACADGISIINMSISGRRPVQKSFSGLNTRLAKIGCLAIEASGNQGLPTYNTDPNVLTIGSTDETGNAVSTSNQSILNGPGDGVDVLGLGKRNDIGYGTSLAVPLVSVIARNVLSVLKKSTKFNALDNETRINLVTKIIRASAVHKNVDGLRAVLLAKAAGENIQTARYDDERLRRFGDFQLAKMRGPSEQKNCSDLSDCGERWTCYKEKRRYVALSEQDKVSKEELKDLFTTALKDRRVKSAARWNTPNPGSAFQTSSQTEGTAK